MKKIMLSVLAVLMAVLLLLAGCGAVKSAADQNMGEVTESSSPSNSSPKMEFGFAEDTVEEEMAFESQSQYDGSSGGGTSVYENAKLILEAYVSLQTLEFDRAVAGIESLTEGFGGYIESSEIYTGGYNSTNSNRSAYFSVRVPSEDYAAFLTSLDQDDVYHVTNLNKTATDVGTEYFDTETRLKTQKIKQERLQTLLAQAESMEDIIALESALSEVEYMIEQYTSTLNRYDDLVGFATISINIDEVVRVTQNVESPSFGSRMSTAFSNGLSSFISALENFVVWLASAILPLLLIAVIIIVILVIIRGVRRRRKKAAEKAAAETAEQKTEKNE